MTINTWNIWQKLGIVRRKVERTDAATDIKAIQEFLAAVDDDVKKLKAQLRQIGELQKENKVLHHHELRISNLEKQIELCDKILLTYEFFETDVDINGERVKRIARALMKDAERNKLEGTLARIRKESRWTFNW